MTPLRFPIDPLKIAELRLRAADAVNDLYADLGDLTVADLELQKRFAEPMLGASESAGRLYILGIAHTDLGKVEALDTKRMFLNLRVAYVHLLLNAAAAATEVEP